MSERYEVAGQGAGRTGPDRRSVAIMFTDIEGFTQTTSRLGDEAAHQLLTAHNLLVRSKIAAHRGREVKTMGDGFLVTFRSVSQALACGAAIQSELAAELDNLKVRIGVHAGSVIRTRGDVHGWNVILASRITSLARGGEVLVSGVARAMANGSNGFAFCDGRLECFDGLTEPQRVHTLHWTHA